jgi:hypothetical protein
VKGEKMNFYDIFKETEQYPENICERGVPQDTLFEYVSNTFLDGLINYVSDHRAYMLERYGKFENGKHVEHKVTDIEAMKTKLEDDVHTALSTCPDDVVVLAESQNSYWFFYYDWDCSDCEIGRVDRASFDSFEKFVEHFKENSRGNMIMLPKPTGWISW